MSVKSSPQKSPSFVHPLAATLDPTVGWHGARTAVSVLDAMATQEDKDAGERVMALREAKGWGREELAFRAKVSLKTVVRIEKGQVEGRRVTFRSIADALEVDEVDILGERPNALGLRLTDQMDGGFDEFRDHVTNLNARLDQMQAAIAKQNANLAEQTDLLQEIKHERAETATMLREIRKAVKVLEGIKAVVSEPAATSDLAKLPEAPEGPIQLGERAPQSEPQTPKTATDKDAAAPRRPRKRA